MKKATHKCSTARLNWTLWKTCKKCWFSSNCSPKHQISKPRSGASVLIQRPTAVWKVWCDITRINRRRREAGEWRDRDRIVNMRRWPTYISNKWDISQACRFLVDLIMYMGIKTSSRQSSRCCTNKSTTTRPRWWLLITIQISIIVRFFSPRLLIKTTCRHQCRWILNNTQAS